MTHDPRTKSGREKLRGIHAERIDGGVEWHTWEQAAVSALPVALDALDEMERERDRAWAALRELQRYGSPGQLEQACWCGAVTSAEPNPSHSPGCIAARAALGEQKEEE